MEQELRTALTEATKELERLRTMLLPEYEGKMAEPDADVIKRSKAVLARKLTTEEMNERSITAFFCQQNIMGNGRQMTRQITEHLCREHRTLQQNFFRVIKQVIDIYGENQGPAFTDLRNEEAKSWAQKVLEAGRDVYLPYV